MGKARGLQGDGAEEVRQERRYLGGGLRRMRMLKEEAKGRTLGCLNDKADQPRMLA